MQKRRAIYLTVEQIWQLSHAVRPVQDAFGGFPVFLVGSVVRGPDWRDVDLRLVLPDSEFKTLFYMPFQLADQFKMLLHTSISTMLRQQTGLPIDFQIQPQSESDKFDREPQQAICHKPWVGPDFVPQWLRVGLKGKES